MMELLIIYFCTSLYYFLLLMYKYICQNPVHKGIDVEYISFSRTE
jgi:hypothetical protein